MAAGGGLGAGPNDARQRQVGRTARYGDLWDLRRITSTTASTNSAPSRSPPARPASATTSVIDGPTRYAPRPTARAQVNAEIAFAGRKRDQRMLWIPAIHDGVNNTATRP